MLPDFLCLGAMRSGTTWLDNILRSHPRIWLPTRRKEVHFFDNFYDRGVTWYEKFFPAEGDAAAYDRIGEMTPKYLYHPDVPGRIRDTLPEADFLIVLRNPVDRAYSHYKYELQNTGVDRSFTEQLEQAPDTFERGLYAEQIKRYLALFPRRRFLVLIFERMVAEPEAACRQVADFLGIDPNRFDLPDDASGRAINISERPRFRRLYAFGKTMSNLMHRWDMDWVVNAAKRVGLNKTLRRGERFPRLDPETRRHLFARYKPDIRELESLLNIDLDVWRNK